MSLDLVYMNQALEWGWQGLGRTHPNPSVGCIIVKDGVIVGAARTADGGRPHAETQALEKAREKARGATVYVTLEPCNTYGKTGPCVEALIKASIARVVIACRDVWQQKRNSRGIETLREAGIIVDIGICEAEAKELHHSFLSEVTCIVPN